jgi:hypothetical protein
VRYYGTTPQEHLWLELKHKKAEVTWKARRRVARREFGDLLAGRVATYPLADLGSSFEVMVLRYQARPLAHVRYVREAYVSELDAYGRVTFDRALSCRRVSGCLEVTDADLWPSGDLTSFDDAVTTVHGTDDSPVVLEIKSETFVPRWMVEIIRGFDLSRRGFSKYCCAVERLGAADLADRRMSAWL